MMFTVSTVRALGDEYLSEADNALSASVHHFDRRKPIPEFVREKCHFDELLNAF